MERYIMLLDWKNQHCENDYTTQSNLQIQCNPYQTTNGIFHRSRIKKFTICMETQKTPNNTSNLEKEKRAGGIRLLDFWLYYKATVIKTVWYWHKNRNIDQWNWDSRNKPIHLWSAGFWQGCQDHSVGIECFLKKWCWQSWISTCTEWSWTLSHTVNKKLLKKWIKYKSRNSKNPLY